MTAYSWMLAAENVVGLRAGAKQSATKKLSKKPYSSNSVSSNIFSLFSCFTSYSSDLILAKKIFSLSYKTFTQECLPIYCRSPFEAQSQQVTAIQLHSVFKCSVSSLKLFIRAKFPHLSGPQNASAPQEVRCDSASLQRNYLVQILHVNCCASRSFINLLSAFYNFVGSLQDGQVLFCLAHPSKHFPQFKVKHLEHSCGFRTTCKQMQHSK